MTLANCPHHRFNCHDYLDYVYELIEGSESFKEIYITMIKSSNGIIFLTETKTRLEILLKSLLTK